MQAQERPLVVARAERLLRGWQPVGPGAATGQRPQGGLVVLRLHGARPPHDLGRAVDGWPEEPLAAQAPPAQVVVRDIVRRVLR